MIRVATSGLSVALVSGSLLIAGCGERASDAPAPETAQPVPSEQSAPPAQKAEAPPADQADSSESSEMDPNMDHSKMPMEPKK